MNANMKTHVMILEPHQLNFHMDVLHSAKPIEKYLNSQLYTTSFYDQWSKTVLTEASGS